MPEVGCGKHYIVIGTRKCGSNVMGRKCTSASVVSCRTHEEDSRISEQVRIGETLRQDTNGLSDDALGLRRQWLVIV